MTNTLEHFIIRQGIVENEATKADEILALSNGLSVPEAQAYWESVQQNLDPLPDVPATESQAITILCGTEGQMFLARSHHQDDDPTQAVYQIILLEEAVMYGMGGDFRPLLALIDEPIPYYPEPETPIPTLILAAPATGSLDNRITLLSECLHTTVQDNFSLLISLLGAALHEQQLLIQNFPTSMTKRIALVQGLMMMLPAAARAFLTFTTHVNHVPTKNPHIVFSESTNETGRWIANWSDKIPLTEDEALQTPYTRLLLELWHDDVPEFIGSIQQFDLLAGGLMTEQTISANLQSITERYQLDLGVEAGDTASAEQLLWALQGSSPPQGKLRHQYLEQLLIIALNERQKETAEFVAREMDQDPTLNEFLKPLFDEAIQTQPDAVYVFVRTRLAEGVDGKWLPRLKEAATHSLKTAITDEDADTLVSWLELIAREPVGYGLADVLADGIEAAQPRASTDGELGMQLILIAAKRHPDTIDTLLGDEALVTQLPADVGKALREYDPHAIEEIATSAPEYFLIAVARATQFAHGPVLTPSSVRSLWEFYADNRSFHLSSAFQPAHIIEDLMGYGLGSLTEGALETLLTLVLSSRDDAFLMTLVPRLTEREILFPILASILQQSGRDIEDIFSLLTDTEILDGFSPEQEIELYVDLLEGWGWHPDTLILVEQLARMFQQSPSIEPPEPVLWKMLELVAEGKVELVARVATRRLLPLLEQIEVREQVIENLLRLNRLLNEYPNANQFMINWWRGYVREQSFAELQGLDKALDGKRPLEDARHIVQTTLALRKVINQQSMPDFASAINITFNTLEIISDAFDPNPRQPLAVDPLTIRSELENHIIELAPDERHILAKNLKELAQLVATMSEHRTKASLIRSDESIDRQLLTGKQAPHSAIDLMKWLSGYLDGAQDSETDEG